MYDHVLERAHAHSLRYLSTLENRHVGTRATREALAAPIRGPLPDGPGDAADVIDHLASSADPGIVASAGSRYFGFVTGGSHPAAVGADWLLSAWDQNGALCVMSPAVSAIEDVAAGWVLDVLGLPHESSVGFVTGAHMANVTGIAAARHEVLRRAGWDVEADGLQGAPKVHVIVGAEAHVSIFAALRLIGFGVNTIVRVNADAQGRMDPRALASTLAECRGPTIVCAQAGHVATGAFDPFPEIADRARTHGAWLHVDGAFGLWAAASPARRHLVAGVEEADSWATDGHKWLNVPYDCGVAICRHSSAHRAAMSQHASYLIRGSDEQRNGMDWTPESSRRARAVPVYATMRALGRAGIADLVDRCCEMARRMADRLRSEPGVEILNDVVLNQVLVRFGDSTAAVIARVQEEGVCWLGGTNWNGRDAMRISVSSWRTTDADIDRSADSIIRAWRAERLAA
jgi:glutamate/tyrosine decarboxylase-like PLP-dependent enzyme